MLHAIVDEYSYSSVSLYNAPVLTFSKSNSSKLQWRNYKLASRGTFFHEREITAPLRKWKKIAGKLSVMLHWWPTNSVVLT